MDLSATHVHSCGENSPPESIIFGNSKIIMTAIRRSLVKVADTSVPILLEGECGTGKEVICKYLHRRSGWGRWSR